jgi:histidine kinase
VAEGDYQQRVPESGLREVRDVARAFNRMSEQVELNNQAQRDLLANVSHDLKTPLTSIQGFSQAIMDGAAPNPTHAASIIYEEAGRLTRLVNQLTELARLKAGRLTMRQDRVDLAALVNAMAEKVEVVAQKKQIALHLQVTPVPLVRGDGDRLAQVVTNLLSNAVKYTPIGGEIWAQVGQESAGVRLSIQDNGIGIPQEDISRIFERFYQVDKVRSTATSTRGHGLGLAIVQEIVEAHGGKIQALSDGRGKGSTFSVWLPTAA